MENNMNKEKIIVPKGVRYIGEWEDYRLENYNFPHILNKVLTGCGFTEYCIKNKQKLILVSPRKFLLENKKDQHPDEVYYVNNELETSIDYELDVSKDDVKAINEKKETSSMSNDYVEENLKKLKEDIRDYEMKCAFRHVTPKFLVTYDSFKHVKSALGKYFSEYQVVVDEFQSIFIDARFKSSTEIEFLQHLQDVKKVCFVSATPMLDKYLDMLDEFKTLPYYELDWKTEDPGRVKKPKLDVKFTTRSLNEEAGRVVQNYLKGNFESRIDSSRPGSLIESKEAVLFFNSVANICQVIRSNGLHLDQCNVLCAKTTSNEKTVKKAFNQVLVKENPDSKTKPKIKGEAIGRIPKKGEPHKMFTFCTRTVYLGADFYSTNARTFIFSDSNIDCLSVDISMDLEQILGRQRLIENPWKDSAFLCVRTTSAKHKVSKEEFDERLQNKIKVTNSLLKTYNNTEPGYDKHNLAIKYLTAAKVSHYKDDYVAINEHYGKDKVPVFNNLMMVSEMRAFEVQQVDYKDRFTVFSALGGEDIDGIREEIIDIAESFNSLPNTTDKLKLLVEFGEREDIEEKDLNNFFQLIPDKYKEYYTILGPDRIRANSYHEVTLKKEWIKLNTSGKQNPEVENKIYEAFLIGSRYSKKDIKNKLKEIYQEEGYQKTAKATDLESYFGLKKVYITSSKEHGFEILYKKDLVKK